MDPPKAQPHQLSKKSHKIPIPDPVIYDGISFYENGQEIKYTDCWQISVLRFLHLVFGEDGTINMEKLKKFMDLGSGTCQKLVKYFEENNKFRLKSEYYETEHGFKLRADWCQFLNKCSFLNIKNGGKYEIAATVPNLIVFFKQFFPKIEADYASLKELNLDNITNKSLFQSYQKILNQIYKQLSINFSITMVLESSFIDYQDIFHFNTLQKISLNDEYLLEWEIYEFYNLINTGDGGRKIKERASGHSDYRYKRKQP